MRKLYLLLVGLLTISCLPIIAQTVSLTALNTPQTQDFNTLAVSGTANTTVPTGWLFSESGSGANATYAASDGTLNGGNTYSFGTGATTERAFGGLQSGSVNPTIGASFTNNTGSTITTLTITYTGEQWRLGATGRADRLDFQYSLNASSLTTGTWTDINTGDFSSPNTTAAAGLLDGNNAMNRKTITVYVTGLNLADGASIFIRWTDFDVSGSDDGLAIDDFSITADNNGASSVSIVAGTDAAEPTTNGSFILSFIPATTTSVTFDYSFTGTAGFSTDYTVTLSSGMPSSLSAATGTITVPAGTGTVTFNVIPADDAVQESGKTIIATLSDFPVSLLLNSLSATINLSDDDVTPVTFTGNYTQDFNSLASSGTSSILPAGWGLRETGSSGAVDQMYAAGTGSSNTGNTYSFGVAGTNPLNDRSLGTLRSNTITPVTGGFFINNTGSTITSLSITYTGEQWRLGGTGRTDRLDFQLSMNTTSLVAGTWTDVDGLDFIAPNSSGTAGIALDGNATGNRTTYTYTINGLSILNGSIFGIRWMDFDLTSTPGEDGLGVDDFIMTLGCTPATNQPTNLTLTPSLQSIDGSFTAADAGTQPANTYLVLMSTSSTLTNLPESGTVYAIDDEIGNAKVVSISGTTFTATGLTPSTTYYFFVFSTSGTTCYNIISPLTGNVATSAPPVCTPPVTQATNLAAANITGTSMDLSWTRGSGSNILVIARSGSPVDAAIYNSLAYSQGTVIGTGNTVIYNGSANSFSYTDLNQNTTYYFALYEYNSAGNCYLTPALTGSFTTLCTNPVNVSSLNGSAGNANTSITWALPASACFDEIIVVASSASITNAGSTYTSPASTNYTGGEQVVYRGTGTTVTVTGLTNNTTYYFKVFTRKGNSYSSGVQITVIPFDPTSGYVYMYGNLHAHSSYSDGNKEDVTKTPADDYAFARDALCMDFLGISEHNHSGAGMNFPDYALGYSQANSLNGVPGSGGNSIVTLWGMEWGVISGGGHVLVYGFNDKLLGWESGNYDIFVAKSDYASLWNTINGQSGAFATLAHPKTTDYTNLGSAYNATADAAIVGQAVESGPAFSTSTTYNDFPSSLSYLSYYRNMLAKGYRLAPQIDQDNHYLTFGTANSSRMVVLSSARSREGLTEAIRSMRYYASNDCNMHVEFKNGNNPMGSQVTGSGVPGLNMTVTDPDLETITSIELWGGEVGAAAPASAIETYNTNNFSFSASDAKNIQPNNTTWYYFAVITQEDGNKAVTAPIWYTRNDAALPVTFISFRGDYDRSVNKVYLTWTTAQEFNSKEFIVERSTDGRVFTAIGKVAAAGNSNRPTTYGFTDAQPVYGANYYRLKQVDMDERSELSTIVKIITDNSGAFVMGPNPASTSLTVRRQNNTEAAHIELMNVNGKLIKQFNMAGTSATLTINVSGLAKGIYLLKLTTTKGIQTEKIMVE
jgi:hypothetical protein